MDTKPAAIAAVTKKSLPTPVAPPVVTSPPARDVVILSTGLRSSQQNIIVALTKKIGGRHVTEVWIYVSACASVFTCMYLCVCVIVHCACMRPCHQGLEQQCARECVRAYACACVRACVCACLRACVRACVLVYARTCMCSLLYMVMCVYANERAFRWPPMSRTWWCCCTIIAICSVTAHTR